MNSLRQSFVTLLPILVLMVGCQGCGETPELGAAGNEELKILGGQYMEFFRARKKTPDNETELKEFIQANMTDVKKELLKITDPNKMFISPRDGKPFVVRYGATISSIPTGDAKLLQGDVVAYEAEGKGGYRHVISSMNHLTELTIDDIKKLAPDAQ